MGNKEKFDRVNIPVQKGDILKLGALGVGNNGDIMFKQKNYILFLKNPENKPIAIGEQIKLRVVKIFPKVGYVELA